MTLDKNGNYITNFHRKGQGPGESIVINEIKVIQDSVYVFGEYGKTSVYSKSGDFIRQFRLFDGKYKSLQIIDSNNDIICYSRNIVADYENKKQYTTLVVHLLDVNKLENYSKILEINSTEDFTNFQYCMTNERRQCCVNSGNVFLEDLSEMNYAVDIYDLKGNKIRRIVKETKRIACSDKIKEKVHDLDLRNSMIKVVADYMKQILRMYADKNGNLWISPAVETFGFEHNYFDIFNSGGVFMKRVKLPLSDSVRWLVFDKDKMIAIDPVNCIVKVFDYEFV